ncbi:MAG: DUF2867 domain-containing protein [Pseudomonadota bacterium]
MRVFSRPLPPLSTLHNRFGPGDFLDCYAVQSDMSARAAAEVITTFPGWAKALVALRGILTAPFGLQNKLPEDAGDAVGIFPVERDDQNEVVAGFNDKHLDFRVSVVTVDGLVHLATWVRPHNAAGRVYLRTIMPFHIAIVRNALARVAAAGQTA